MCAIFFKNIFEQKIWFIVGGLSFQVLHAVATLVVNKEYDHVYAHIGRTVYEKKRR